VDLLVEDPPSDATSVAGIFSPLFRDPGLDPGWLFPRLWDALAHPATAGPVLDLANFLVRKGRVAAHPGRGRVQQLAELLAGVVGRLGRLEQHRPAALEEFQAQAGQVNDGVALAVSLCDALALIGDPSVAGKLYQALEVSHRRVRVEAAAALARLGERPGIEALVQLAAEPIVRLRVLAYADELGLEDQIDQTWRTSVARAEAELVLWLAQPAQIGIPPTRCELLDARTQYWPGFQEPVECFLFRFEYELGPTHFSNIALAGPATYAFAADLSDLSPDDIFAAFAGWYAEHDEIREIDADQLDSSQRIEVARLQRRLHDEGYGAIVPRKLGEFFGDPVLVATAIREGRPGIAVTDRLQSYWLPQSASRRPPGAEEAYCIYKGRRLLRTFNE
jgi:hypothetical protein